MPHIVLCKPPLKNLASLASRPAAGPRAIHVLSQVVVRGARASRSLGSIAIVDFMILSMSIYISLYKLVVNGNGALCHLYFGESGEFVLPRHLPEPTHTMVRALAHRRPIGAACTDTANCQTKNLRIWSLYMYIYIYISYI